MSASDPSPPAARPDGLVQLAALVLVVLGLQAARAWLLPVCFALLLAVLGDGLLRWLQRGGVPRPVAALVALGAIGGGVWLVMRALVRALADFGVRLPQHERHLRHYVDDVVQWAGSIGLHVDTADLLRSIEPRTWLGFVQQSVGGLFGLSSAFVLAGIAFAFAIWEGDTLRERFGRAYGAAWDQQRAAAMVGDLQRYLGVKTLTSLLTGVTVYGLNRLFGVESALLWGVLAFVLNYVPIVGSIVAAVPPLLLVLASPAYGIGTALGLAIGYLIVNNVISNLLEPVLMGRQFGLPALSVLLALVFWGWVWGPGGMFLAVPLTIVVGTVVGARRDLPWLRALVGR